MPTPTEQQAYIFFLVLLSLAFLGALIRAIRHSREEQRLLKNKEALEGQIVRQQKDLLHVRQDANAWRAEMQRQVDVYRHTATTQLEAEEKRFQDLLAKSTRREQELLTALEVTRQMCSELPSAKARVLYLEALLAGPPPRTVGHATHNGGERPQAQLPLNVSPMPDVIHPPSATQPPVFPAPAAFSPQPVSEPGFPEPAFPSESKE